jgi:EmrB/QacA subfamily drug resistance transporter
MEAKTFFNPFFGSKRKKRSRFLDSLCLILCSIFGYKDAMLQRATLIPLIVACALFMEHLDSSIIATALPAIAQSLRTDPLHLNLAITSYLFSLALFIPLSGWTADRFGARTIFRAAILIFTLASVACGFATSLSQLVIARLIQGMGGAMMVPVGRLLLLRTVEKSELVNAMAWMTAPALVGPVVGPPLGGFIVTHWTWHWIFFINLPIGLLGMYLVSRFVDNIREDVRPPLDLRGFGLMALALGGLVVGFETVGRHLVPTRVIGAAILTGTISFVLYMLHARRTEDPIIDLTLFKIRTFTINVIGGSVFRLGTGAMPFLLPLLFQIGFGLSALQSGMLTFASSAGAVLMKLTATPLLRRFGFRTIMIHNAWISNAFIILYAYFDPGMGPWLIGFVLLVSGFARSIQFTALNTLAFADIPASHMSRASTIATMMQQLSLSAGVAAAALILNVTIGDRSGESLQIVDFRPAFWIIGIVSILSALWFRALPSNAGDLLTGRDATR